MNAPSRRIFVRVEVVDGLMTVTGNVPFEAKVALLESAKLLLITESTKPPTITKDPDGVPVTQLEARSAAFSPRTIA